MVTLLDGSLFNDARHDQIFEYGAGIGYRFSDGMTISSRIIYYDRMSNFDFEERDGFRIQNNISYTF